MSKIEKFSWIESVKLAYIKIDGDFEFTVSADNIGDAYIMAVERLNLLAANYHEVKENNYKDLELEESQVQHVD